MNISLAVDLWWAVLQIGTILHHVTNICPLLESWAVKELRNSIETTQL